MNVAALNLRSHVAPAEMTLAAALVRLYGWRQEWFDDNGPNSPYIRVGFSLIRWSSTFDPLPRRDRLSARRIPARKLLERFGWIQISRAAYSEIAGGRWLDQQRFPFDQWLELTPRSLRNRGLRGKMLLYPVDTATGVEYAVAIGALCLGEGIRVRLRSVAECIPRVDGN
jgi:hypothetical protein